MACRGGRNEGVCGCFLGGGGREGWGVYVWWCCVLASATAPPTALPTQQWGTSGEPLATPEIRPSAARLSMDQCWSAGDRIRWVGRETLAVKMDTVRPARGGRSQAPACARHCCRAEKIQCQRCGNRRLGHARNWRTHCRRRSHTATGSERRRADGDNKTGKEN